MSSHEHTGTIRSESPDPSSHATNIYDTEEAGGESVDEEDDDDMDFEPMTDDSEDVEFFDPTDEVEAEFHGAESDADDGLSGVEIEFSMDNDEDAGQVGNETETETPTTQPAATVSARPPLVQVTRSQILRLFGHHGLQDLFRTHQANASGNPPLDDDEDDGYTSRGSRRRRRGQDIPNNYPPIPSDEGRRLMGSGTFGESGSYEDKLRKRKDRLSRRLIYRELGVNQDTPGRDNRLISQGLIPSSNADAIIHYNARCYSGQFSDDGNFFFCCGQDFKVRMYDTSNPYKWNYYKTAEYPYGQWTITDASLSPDNKFLAYSSIRSVVFLAPTDPTLSAESPAPLDFRDMGRARSQHQFSGGYSHFGIWSIRFSGDGREVVAGTSDHSVYVYDIEAKQTILRIPGHNDDVNAVCFGDNYSPHILYSGSDDTLIKVWDRRSMGDSREAGVFMGHTEGLTYVDSKGDGRYVLSNGKDQTMKLWDLRKMMPTEKASQIDANRYSTGFDYRFMPYSEAEYEPHPYDCSLVTFRGHRVLKTLIRCHFSPPGSTDSRYVYSGSEDGCVYIYKMDATLAGKIEVNKATYHSRPRDSSMYSHPYYMRGSRNPDAWKTCVRDVSWHPNAPVVAEDDEGEPKMGVRVNQLLEEDPSLYDHPQRGGRTSQFRSRLRSQRVPPVGGDADDDDGDGW
ncbi:MAG: hypothetical protein Q9166_002045 [cf. Caloplaca sp. 2 TL-2023]